jgi:hypothetical protein
MSREKTKLNSNETLSSEDKGNNPHYSLALDNDTIEKLRQYYNIRDEGEILRFVKRHGTGIVN